MAPRGVAVANVFIHHRQALSAWNPPVRITPELIVTVTLAYWIVNSFYIYPLMSSVAGYHGVMNFLGIFSIFSAMLIYAVATAPRTALTGFLASSLMGRAGEATYGTYLLHLPLLAFVDRNIASLDVAGASGREAFFRLLSLLLGYAFVVLVSYGVFRGFEAPARRWIRKHCTRAAICGVLAVQLALFMTGVAIVTYTQRDEHLRHARLAPVDACCRNERRGAPLIALLGSALTGS